MANLNKVMLIGRLTRDPEVRMFSNGGKVAKFGFAVNNRKKNVQTGQWEDDPVFITCEAFNRGEFGKLADLCEQYLRKGAQAFIDGHLKLDQWTSQDGQKRQELRVMVDNVQFLEPRDSARSGGGAYAGGGYPGGGPSGGPRRSPSPSSDDFDPGAHEPPMDPPPPRTEPEGDIPF